MNQEHVAILRQGPDIWNRWRRDNPRVAPGLSDLDFERDVWEGKHHYDLPVFESMDFSGANLCRVVARNSTFSNCCFDGAEIHFSDLCFSYFMQCSFRDVGMRVTKIGSATFEGCTFQHADLSYCTAEETDFIASSFVQCSLDHVRLVKANLTDAVLEDVSVYGGAAWDLTLEGTSQRNIRIGGDAMSLSVDNLEVAQFIHLLVRNSRLREVIDTVTSRVVLILGRFTPPRKLVLNQIRGCLTEHGYVPVVFDFDGPKSRDLTETVATLAHLSRFVVADLSEPRSVPHELSTFVPHLPSVPVQPIIVRGEEPFGMFEHFQRYEWVLPVRYYGTEDLSSIAIEIIDNCEAQIASRGSA